MAFYSNRNRSHCCPISFWTPRWKLMFLKLLVQSSSRGKETVFQGWEWRSCRCCKKKGGWDLEGPDFVFQSFQLSGSACAGSVKATSTRAFQLLGQDSRERSGLGSVVWLGGVVTCCSRGFFGVSWLKGASLTRLVSWVNKESASVLQKLDPDQRRYVNTASWCCHHVGCNCFQMKVESMVLVSCALRARASKSCFIKADFSCSSCAMRSLFSVTSLMQKGKWSECQTLLLKATVTSIYWQFCGLYWTCVRSRFWSFSLWMACGGAGGGGWEFVDRAAVWAPPEGNDCWETKRTSVEWQKNNRYTHLHITLSCHDTL